MKLHSLTRILFAAVSCFFLLDADGKTYFFSSSDGIEVASDNLDTTETPVFKSIDQLNRLIPKLQPGDSVLFKRGDVFYGSIQLLKSGTEQAPIFFGNYGTGPLPVMKGTTELRGWVGIKKGIYATKLPSTASELRLVTIDGAPKPKGRFPNSDPSNGGFIPLAESLSNTLVSTQDLGAEAWTGAEIVVRKNHWIIDTEKITKQEGRKLTISKSNDYKISEGFGFFIQNHLGTLDTFGEWYFDPAESVLYIFFGSQRPENHQVEIGTQNHLITTLGNTRNIIIDGLVFEGSNQNTLQLLGGSNFTIQNCSVKNSGQDGIFAINHCNLKIINTLVKNSFNNGINLKSGNDAAYLAYNTVSCTYLYPGMGQNGDGNGFAIFSVSNRDVIKRNRIEFTGYSGIGFRGNGTIVEENLIEQFCLTKNDGGGIYTYTGASNIEFRDRIIRGNIILHGVGNLNGTNLTQGLHRPQVEGVYLDDNASGIIVTENSIAHIPNFGINVHNARNIEITKNLIVDAYTAIHLGNDERGSDVKGISISHNKLITGNPNQYTLGIFDNRTITKEIVHLHDNLHYSLFGNEHLIHLRRRDDQRVVVSTPVRIQAWVTTSILETNSKHIIENRSFLKNIIPSEDMLITPLSNTAIRHLISCNSGCTLDWDTPNLLHINHKKRSSLKIDLGKVTDQTDYELMISGTSNKKVDASVFLRYREEPYTAISSTGHFSLDESTSNSKLYLPNFISLDESSLIIQLSSETDQMIKIDRIEFRKVKSTKMTPEEYFTFTYNFGSSKIQIDRPSKGITFNLNSATTISELPAYSAAILF